MPVLKRLAAISSVLLVSLSLSACDLSIVVPETSPSPTEEPGALPSGEPEASPSPPPASEPPEVIEPSLPPPPGGMPSICAGSTSLKVLDSTGIQNSLGLQTRLFETPFPVGSVYFDAMGQAQVFSSDREQQAIFQTGLCGDWQATITSPVLKGRNGKNALPGPDGNIIMALDYWPDDGNSEEGLFRLGPSLPAQEILTGQSHAGLTDLMAVPDHEFLRRHKGLSGVRIPDNAKIQVMQSNYTFGPIGSLFYDTQGDLYLINSSSMRQGLIKWAADGPVTRVAQHDLLRSTPWKHGTVVNGQPVITIDYAPDTGNGAQGIYQFGAGEPLNWKTTQGHAGLHDIVSDGQGGVYYADFENDGLWHQAGPNSPERFVIDREHNVVPGALLSLTFDAEANQVYGINWVNPDHWWAGGGEKGIYQISPQGGTSALYAKAPEDSRYYGLTQGQGGIWGRDLYTIDEKTQAILRIKADGQAIPVIEGLPNPQDLKIDPRTGTLTVLCDRQYLVQIGTEFSDLKSTPAPAEKGWYFTDFENDNLWYMSGLGAKEEGVMDTEILPGLFSMVYQPDDGLIYGLNRGGGWPFGGQEGLYRILPGGRAELVETPSQGTYGDLTWSPQAGAFPRGLYFTESETGRLLQRNASGELKTVLSGLQQPSSVAVSPSGDALLVVVNEGKGLLWLAPSLPPLTGPSRPEGENPGDGPLF